jgi:hypothetical protein
MRLWKMKSISVIYAMKSGFRKGQEVMAPRSGKIGDPKTKGIVLKTYGEWITVAWTHEIPGQEYTRKSI